MSIPRILVCGGRNYGDLVSLKHNKEHPLWAKREKEYNHIKLTLYRIINERGWYYDDEYKLPNVRIISGGARGVDTVAIDWAVVNWTDFKEYPADWKKYHKAAGPIRNQQMLDEEHPDLVVAFPGGEGTADMVRRAKAAGIEVIEVEDEGVSPMSA